jgi:predicted XRE-type DNA-binding protein
MIKEISKIIFSEKGTTKMGSNSKLLEDLINMLSVVEKNSFLKEFIHEVIISNNIESQNKDTMPFKLNRGIHNQLVELSTFLNSLLKMGNDFLSRQNSKVNDIDFLVFNIIFFLHTFTGNGYEFTNLLNLTEQVDELIQNKGKLKNRINEILKEKNISQKELSEKTGIDKANLSQYMHNKSQPSLDFFFKIWSAMGYPALTKILYKEDEKSNHTEV